MPPLTRAGDLPIGVHRATLSEVIGRFGAGSLKRGIVGGRLERIYHLARATGQLARFVIFGSFVTNQPEPNDVDVFLLMQGDFDASQLQGQAELLFDHAAAAANFGATVFWMRRSAALGGEQTAIEDWQITRGGRRGIVEIVEESS